MGRPNTRRRIERRQPFLIYAASGLVTTILPPARVSTCTAPTERLSAHATNQARMASTAPAPAVPAAAGPTSLPVKAPERHDPDEEAPDSSNRTGCRPEPP